MRKGVRLGPLALALPACAWLLVFFVVPLLLVARLSLYRFAPASGILPGVTLDNFTRILGEAYYVGIFARTIRISAIVTLLCLLVGYPEAYYLARLRGKAKAVLLVITLSPLLVSAVTRTFGWLILLAPNGVVNAAIVGLGVSATPLKLLYSETGIVIGLTHVLVPFMILSIYATIQRQDATWLRAAATLGATPIRQFLEVTWPLSLPGVVTGCVLVFTLSMSAFVTPAILGGSRVRVVAFLTYEEFLASLDWPFGAALALLLLVLTLGLVAWPQRVLERSRWSEVFR